MEKVIGNVGEADHKFKKEKRKRKLYILLLSGNLLKATLYKSKYAWDFKM